MLSRSRLKTTLQRMGIMDAGRMPDDLLSAYSAPTRFYHDATHIAACLKLLDRFRELARRPDEIELALWFHDAIYDTQRNDNEEKSADWARSALAALGMASERIDRIAEMVVATKHHRADDDDTRLLLDIDLSILGTSPSVFQGYDDAIRKEYAWVPDEAYRSARARILDSFLHRETIFQTNEFRVEYEAIARDNLRRRIAELKEPNEDILDA